MKISNELLDELVIALTGEDILPLIHILRNKNNVSEFKLAEKLNVTVNQTRNMLYRLNEHNLVTFMRKKDKKKGWYIYYWTLNQRSANNALKKLREKQLSDFKIRLEREQIGIFYVCPMGCMRLKMEVAMDYDFKCQECGALLRVQDNMKTIENIKNRIASLEEELEKDRQLREEMVAKRLKAFKAKEKREAKKKEKEKIEKMKARRIIAEEKRKAKKLEMAKNKVVKKKVVKKKKIAKKKVVKKKKVTKKKVVKKKKVAKKKVVKKKKVAKKKVVKKKKVAKKKVAKKKISKK